ncbi:M48 family metallopeptidase [Anaeromicropila herbilytica]|uniref:YgjP-like metallopeptidase domain-containing protein n=1 Tax=Anaeromicropila herbilytica TaxID=2785025 RepID=A0A7R7EPT1_9FIRM|nr:SprT family zinc-dependent metalloprotease [Anaeromicropila herbilytica]BCN32799.1 hypothetical protein bsdtb5_40940 [Anaeromicropila herbilytica]
MLKDKGILEYGNLKIPYEIDYGKRKHIYISIKNNLVTVKVPLRTNKKIIEDILLQKEEWIKEKYQIQQNNVRRELIFMEGEMFYVFGKQYQLKIRYEDCSQVSIYIEHDNLLVTLPKSYQEKELKPILEHSIQKFYQKLVKNKIEERITYLSEITSLYPKKVTIKKLTRSWGRCSSSGNISLNRDLVFYQDKVIDYVILHELSHLKYMNHSRDFWNLVAEFMPDYKEQEKILNNKK